MSTGFHEGTCGCGGFRYAGHRCTPGTVPAAALSETARLAADRQKFEDVGRTVSTAYGLVPWERQVLAGLLDAEQQRITARLAELEGTDDE